jgi:uncharacterized protein
MKDIYIALLIMTIPSLSFAASINCDIELNPVESVICADPMLLELDRSLAQAYNEAESIDPGIVYSQHGWLLERDECATKECIADKYKARIGQLLVVVDDAEKQEVSSEVVTNEMSKDMQILKNSAESKQEVMTTHSQNLDNQQPSPNYYNDVVLLSIMILCVVGYFAFATKCPDCGKPFAAKNMSKELINEGMGRKTVDRVDKHKGYVNGLQTVIKEVHRKEQVDTHVKIYKITHKCRYCNFEWTSIKKEEKEL